MTSISSGRFTRASKVEDVDQPRSLANRLAPDLNSPSVISSAFSKSCRLGVYPRSCFLFQSVVRKSNVDPSRLLWQMLFLADVLVDLISPGLEICAPHGPCLALVEAPTLPKHPSVSRELFIGFGGKQTTKLINNILIILFGRV